MTGEYHEKILKKYLEELEAEGYNVLDLERKCPDGIAVKDNKIYAVEVLGVKARDFEKDISFRNKKLIYSMFDGVLFRIFNYKNKNIKPFKKELFSDE